MRQRIAHVVSQCQRKLWVCGGEFRMSALDVAACLADHLEIADHCSYGTSLCEHSRTELVWQPIGGQHVHGHAQQLSQLHSNRANVEQRRFRCRVDQDIKIASLDVLAAQDRPKNPRIASTMRRNYAPNGRAIQVQGFRWSQDTLRQSNAVNDKRTRRTTL